MLARLMSVEGRARRRVFGDWQTPPALARAVVEVVARGAAPAAVLEPTCGEGSLLVAAGERWPAARLVGYELDEGHAAVARGRVRGRVEVADCFAVDWARVVAELPAPLLVLGNLPWVTRAGLGALGAANGPAPDNFKRLRGLAARTGEGNFDVSEWMLLRLLAALAGRRATLAFLCKTAVARRVLEHCGRAGWAVGPGGLWRVDARRHFAAAVDASLLVCELGGAAAGGWPVYAGLADAAATSRLAVVDGVAVADAGRLAATAHLAGASAPAWRSGIKHDCAPVMELRRAGDGWVNGLGERVEIEDACRFPLRKGSDVAGGRAGGRAVVVPQRGLADDPAALQRTAPRTWAYLCAHRASLAARRSSVYRGRPEFAVFGVGPYSFAPWKVAVSGLHKRCEFALVGPEDGRPVLLDDTCYFLPFDDEAEARASWAALGSAAAREFFAARVFWDAKRPIRKALLQTLDLRALRAAVQPGAST
jgi:hypothetical protein